MAHESGRQLVIPWVIQGNEAYGVRSATLYLTAALNEVGVQTPLISLSDGPFAQECQQRGLHVVQLGVGRMPGLRGGLHRKAFQLPVLIRHHRLVRDRLLDAARQAGAHALHFRRPNLVGLVGSVARALGVPAFWQMPNYIGDQYPLGLNRRYYQWQCHRSNIVPLANSAYTGSTLGDRPVKPVIFHLAVDAARFNPDAVDPVPRAELNIPEHATVLGIFARLDPSKGQDRILQAMLNLVGHGEDLHLLLLGGPDEGPMVDQLREMAAQHQASPRLHLVGQVSDPERYYHAVDIAINSRVDAEPFGLSVIEAMMMGRPMLVHALGGPAETVVDGVTGWHMADPSVATFTAGLERALADRARWPEMRTAARKHALDHFTVENQVQRYLAVVERTLSGENTSA